MANNTSGRKKSQRSTKSVDPKTEARDPPSRAERAKTYAQSVFAKGAHDTAAHFVKLGIISIIALIVGWAGYNVVGQYEHFQVWPPTPRLETGSIKKTDPPKSSAAEELRKRADADCKALKDKEVVALVVQRQTAFSTYENCLVEYKQKSNSDPTPRQYCASKLAEHIKLRQAVIDREARPCTMASK